MAARIVHANDRANRALDAQQGRPGHDAAPGAQQGRPGHDAAPGAQQGRPGHDAVPGAQQGKSRSRRSARCPAR